DAGVGGGRPGQTRDRRTAARAARRAPRPPRSLPRAPDRGARGSAAGPWRPEPIMNPRGEPVDATLRLPASCRLVGVRAALTLAALGARRGLARRLRRRLRGPGSAQLVLRGEPILFVMAVLVSAGDEALVGARGDHLVGHFTVGVVMGWHGKGYS